MSDCRRDEPASYDRSHDADGATEKWMSQGTSEKQPYCSQRYPEQ